MFNLIQTRNKALLTYSIDFALIGICSLLAFLIECLPPFERVVFIDDKDISYPFKRSETIPGWSLPLFCAFLPLMILFLVAFIKKRNIWASSIAVLGMKTIYLRTWPCLLPDIFTH